MLQDRNASFEKILLVAIFTTFMGQIYLSPFGSEFRLTLAVVVLNILMLTFLDIKAIPTINLVGLLMFVVRTFVFVFNGNGTLMEAFNTYYPVIFFYVFYSLFFELLDVRSYLRNPIALFLSIWICDSIPNIIEVIIRREWQVTNFEEVIYTIIMIGLFRTVFTTIMIYVSNYYYQHLKDRQNHQKFVERIVMLSSLRTELFFLRKSKIDIEEAMRRSFEIYERLDESQEKNEVLAVAKDIHEIKKDYSRVIAGIEKSIEETSSYYMEFYEIINIVIETNKRLAESRGKHIKFEANRFYNFRTTSYYVLISILNNLVVNAMEAIDFKGTISIYENRNGDDLYLSVYDTGSGIEEGDIALIFEPGFSTKYNENNGIMASGIGLTHVKYLVTGVLGGTIEVTSVKGQNTTFHLMIPLQNIVTDRIEITDEKTNEGLGV